MTLDELLNIGNEAADDVASKAERMGLCPSGVEMGRARTKAVVAALRDEMQSTVQEYASPECCGIGTQTYYAPPECCGNPYYKINTDNVLQVLNEILASDGVEAAGSATAQTEGDVHDTDREGERQRCVPQGVSAVDGRGEGSAGADQGQRFGAVQRDRGRSAQQNAIAGAHEAGRSGDVGGQRHHGVSRGEAAGVTDGNASPASAPVCEWTRISEFDTVMHYSTPHGVMNDLNLWRGLQCPACHAPISFKSEAAR